MIAKSTSKKDTALRPFRRAVLRGLGIMLPPLLTIILFLSLLTALNTYLLRPVVRGAEQFIVWRLVEDQVLDETPTNTSLVERDAAEEIVSFQYADTVYKRLHDGKYVPEAVYSHVVEQPGELLVATATTRQLYGQYVRTAYLRPTIVVPLFVALFLLLLYLTGKLVSARIGRIMWRGGEAFIERLPVVRNVYSSVKQITDFMFNERDIKYTRVVAVEYPRKGIWSVGFMTGESLLDISSSANQSVVTVLIPTSPMPATGYTITVPKSETIDLNLTFDQAIQFIVSCGVVVPPHQQHPSPSSLAKRIEQSVAGNESQSPSTDPPLVGALPPGDS